MGRRIRDRVQCVNLGRRGPRAWKRGSYFHTVVYVGANVRAEAKHYPVGSVSLNALPILEQRRLKLS
jgi:hypothetical protein